MAAAENTVTPMLPPPPDPAVIAEEIAQLTNTQRAAVMLMLLGEEEAAAIIKHLSPKEVQHLSSAMVSVADLSQEAVSLVLDGFIATIKKQTNLGGGLDYLESILKSAIGEDRAASVLSRIMPASASRGLEVLQWMDPRSIAEMVGEEHPQIVAIVMSFLEFEVAADVLRYLPENIRGEVVARVASLETIQPTAMQELEMIIGKQFSSNSSLKSSSVGGVKHAAKIMNFVKSDIEQKLMRNLGESDADLAQRIQDNMFAFENLDKCDNRSIQALMRAVSTDQLMVALKGANDIVKDRFLSNMSARAREMFVDEMEGKGPVRLAEVEEMQKQILRTARKLADAGEMMLGGGADYV